MLDTGGWMLGWTARGKVAAAGTWSLKAAVAPEVQPGCTRRRSTTRCGVPIASNGVYHDVARCISHVHGTHGRAMCACRDFVSVHVSR